MAVVRQPVEVFRLEPSEWDRFKEPILRFERRDFPAGLQEDASDLRRLVESPTSIVIGIRTDDNALAGYIAADELENFGDVPGAREDPHWQHRDTYYIATVVVAPEMRLHGCATLLTRRCVEVVARNGRARVTAHMAAGAAAKIDPRIRICGSYPDWYGTGRTFEYIEIPLVVAE